MRENFLHVCLIFATWPRGENQMREHFLCEKKAMRKFPDLWYIAFGITLHSTA